MTDNKQQDPRWFKNPMVWLVILFPTTAVVASMITIVIAVNTEDGLVVDNYYKEGLEINQDISADSNAEQLGVSAFVDINTQSGEILLELSSDTPMTIPTSVDFRLIHRTRSGLDQQTTLSRLQDHSNFRGYIKPPIGEGRWTVEVSSANQWRVRQNLTTKTAQNILLNITH